MFGAIIGDIAGSRFEFHNHKNKDFTLFHNNCFFTDDTVCSIAIYKALHASKKHNYEDLEEKCIEYLKTICVKYPDCGYGGSFWHWIFSSETRPYNSWGNGSAMRTSECGMIAESLEEALELAETCAAVTHNHPEGIKGAKAVSACIYLAKTGSTIEEIRDYVNKNFYKLDFTLDEIRDDYRFDVSCQGSVPQAIEAFLESESFEDSIRNAVSIGGDSDTIGAITGGIAEAYYGVPEDMTYKAKEYLDSYLKDMLEV